MSTPTLVYPTVRGMSWKITRTPTWDTLVQRMSSGKELRLGYWQYPLWKWEIEYEYLKDDPNDLIVGQVDTDLTILQGFFNQMAGQLTPFLFDDIIMGETAGEGRWDSVTGQAIATSDGVTMTYPLVRTTGGFTEAIQAPYTTPTPVVYSNGVALTPGGQYSIDAFGNILLVSALPLGAVITADFGYYWPVRFGSDDLDFETMFHHLWDLKKVTLQQVRL